jgi:hypothetical protein
MQTRQLHCTPLVQHAGTLRNNVLYGKKFLCNPIPRLVFNSVGLLVRRGSRTGRQQRTPPR